MASENAKCEDTQDFYKVLEDNSTSKFFMEYNGYLSNHVSHGIIALRRLGARKDRLERFVNWYQDRLESPNGSTAEHQVAAECNIDDLRGARKGFYTIYEYYQEKLGKEYAADIAKLVQEEFPKLSRGLVASLLHGLIQLGYGCAVRSPRIVVEGLAYLHHSYLPIRLSREHPNATMVGRGDTDVGEVLEELRDNVELHEYMISEVQTEKLRNWNSPPQRRLAALLQAKGDCLMDLVMKIKCPTTNGPKSSMKNATSVAKWVVDQAIFVYTKAESKNDFVLLHGVTAAWSMFEIVKLLQDPDAAFDTITTYLCCLLATFVTQDCPKLDNNPVSLKYNDWNDIVAEAVSRDCDEHIYKLVQVAFELNREFGDPDLLYKEAANAALCNKLSFIKY